MFSARKCSWVCVGRFIEGLGRNYGSCKRSGSVEVLEQCSSKRYDGYRCVNGYAREGWDVFAAMHVCAEMRSSRMSEQDERECRNVSGVNAISFDRCILDCLYTAVHENPHTGRHLPLYLFDFFDVKAFVPTYINKHLHASIEFEQRL